MYSGFNKRFGQIFLNDRVVMGLIVINSLLIFIREFDVQGHFLSMLETVFTLFFILELSVKLQSFGIRKYLSSGWNKFDFIIIVISVPSLGSLFIEDLPIDLNFLLILRLLRIFRLFRLMRFFPHISSMIAGIRRAILASYVVLLSFLILLFVFSLISCTLFKNIAPEYFSNPLISLYSTFRLFSIEGWYEIPDIIAERSTSTIALFSKIYFIIMLFFGGILGLSLVNSIFVDAMVSDNNDALEQQVKELAGKLDDLNKKMDRMLEGNDAAD